METLGQRYGVPIEFEEGSGPSREERSLRQELFDLHEQAAVHFHDAFKAAGPAGDFMRAYWVNERRFTPDLADEFKIGAAGSDGSALGAAILKKRYSEDALRQCGLFFIRDDAMITAGALRPRFRGRLMIPIRDHQGRVVAFTARQTSLTPDDDPAKEAKYVNSPETPIFTKGHLLFNLDRARTAVGEGRPFVMVEGQLDWCVCQFRHSRVLSKEPTSSVVRVRFGQLHCTVSLAPEVGRRREGTWGLWCQIGRFPDYAMTGSTGLMLRTFILISTRDPSRLMIDIRRSSVNRPRSALRMREKSAAAMPVRVYAPRTLSPSR